METVGSLIVDRNEENMTKFDYNNEISEIGKQIEEIAAKYGFDYKKDEFRLIQPYEQGQAITLEAVEEDGQRKVNIDIFDNLHILPVKSGTLSIFKEEG